MPMTKKAKQITPHIEDLVAGVHSTLKEKGIEGIQVSAIHFTAAAAGPPGMKWDCRPDPTTGGVHCGWFPVA
jgi:hypothetical protein